jgi:peptide/nickel transport system substrate-binding protein
MGDAFVDGVVLPRKHFAGYMGAKSRDAPANLKPIGTGPYRAVDFKPGDLVRGELNSAYHMPHRPHFDTIEIKGGGDSVSAANARSLLKDRAGPRTRLPERRRVLQRMEDSGRGRVTSPADRNRSPC